MQLNYLTAICLLVFLVVNSGAQSAWTNHVSPTEGGSTAIATDGTNFMAITGEGDVLYQARGGLWRSIQHLPVYRSFSDAAYFQGSWYAVAEREVSHGVLLKSSDAIDWVEAAAPQTHRLYRLSVANGRLFVGGDAVLLYTADGLSWNTVAFPENRRLQTVAYLNGQYAAGALGTSIVMPHGTPADLAPSAAEPVASTLYLSTNLLDWSPAPRRPETIEAIAAGNERFVAVTPTHLLVSTNGLDWEQVQYHFMPWNQSILHANGYFCWTAPIGIYTSIDGIGWELQVDLASGPHRPLKMAANQDRIVVVGERGLILESQFDVHLRTRVFRRLMRNTLHGPGNREITVESSQDLVTWRALTNAPSGVRPFEFSRSLGEMEYLRARSEN